MLEEKVAGEVGRYEKTASTVAIKKQEVSKRPVSVLKSRPKAVASEEIKTRKRMSLISKPNIPMPRTYKTKQGEKFITLLR